MYSEYMEPRVPMKKLARAHSHNNMYMHNMYMDMYMLLDAVIASPCGALRALTRRGRAQPHARSSLRARG